MKNIHATCISYRKKGIILIGPPGSGKSDLALRMIMQKGAKLVSDDYTNISVSGQSLYASPPAAIKGLLEIRGLGIKKFPFVKKQKLHLIVELSKNIERMPKEEYFTLETHPLPKIKLNPFEPSAIDKLEAYFK